MSKNSERKARREAYYTMLDNELSEERAFMGRILDTINRGGMDVAPDGRPIRADFWRYIASRKNSKIANSRAGQDLLERAVRTLRVHQP